MSYKTVKNYVDNFYEKEIPPRLCQGDDSDAYLLLDVLRNNPDQLQKKEVSDALVSAIKRTSQYMKFKWEEDKEILFNSFNWFDLQLLKLILFNKKVSNYIKFHINSWKTAAKIYKPRNDLPMELIPVELSADDELVKYLQSPHWNFLIGNREVAEKDADPIVIKANIEHHATGKVARMCATGKLARSQSIKHGLMKEATIVSYNVIPGKELNPADKEDFYDPRVSQANFTREGERPPEVDVELPMLVKVSK